MPEQLIFTSKPIGIQPGRSGFQIVAQHSTINHRLAAALEKESIYEFSESSAAKPVLCKYQKFQFGDDHYSVLTRIQSCGVDFTGRPNHIAHHVIFKPDEIPACPPAAIFALWKGWRQKWDNKPRFFGGWDRVNYENEAEPFYFSKFALPAKTWKSQTGDEGTAAIPVLNESSHLLFPIPEGKEDALIWLFLESQSLLPIKKAWDITFTNCRIENDNPNKYRWIGCLKQSGMSEISIDADEIHIFDPSSPLIAPDHEIADKARNSLSLSLKTPPRKKESAISIAPIEEHEPIQDELGLGAIDTPPKPAEDELLESTLSSTLPDQHSDEVFGDIFKSDPEDTVPDLSFEAKEEELPDHLRNPSLQRRLKTPLIVVVLLLVVAVTIWLTPSLIALFNHQADPAPSNVDSEPTKEEMVLKERLATVEMDPDSRFASQIGDPKQVIASKQFLLARAFLSKYSNDEKVQDDKDFLELKSWFYAQKLKLSEVNNELIKLEDQISEKRVLPHFDEKKAKLAEGIDGLADDLQPSLRDQMDKLSDTYQRWLNQVRLKTENVPTFIIPISRENPNPEITFTNLPDAATNWLLSLDQFPVTSQIEHIQIQVSPFRGLNQFELSAQDAIHLSLWKHSNRSLISYLDGQTEVLEAISDPGDINQIGFHWKFDASTSTFPEPPIILSFLNTLTNQALNVVMMGGISQTVITPAEVPFSFLKLDKERFRFDVLDPVLKEKLQLFLLPPSRFLQLKSPDDRYYFAWDSETSAFHLFESKSFDPAQLQEIQKKIATEHKVLADLTRQQTIHKSVDFIRKTPLWSLGSEVLPNRPPEELKTFGNYFRSTPQNYFEYLRALITYFASEYTMIRPAVMEKWIAYPKGDIPKTKEEIIAYRNMLLRICKRFRSLLNQDDPNTVEHWRNFVANLEFWLLGENKDQLIDVLSLSPSEIELFENTVIEEVERDIQLTRDTVSELQSQLQNSSSISEVYQIDQWLLEMTSLENPALATPLILFK